MNIIMENSNKQAPNFLTKKLINFGDAHKEQTDLYLANIKQDKFYKKDEPKIVVITPEEFMQKMNEEKREDKKDDSN